MRGILHNAPGDGATVIILTLNGFDILKEFEITEEIL
jgi:hypothetical protein